MAIDVSPALMFTPAFTAPLACITPKLTAAAQLIDTYERACERALEVERLERASAEDLHGAALRAFAGWLETRDTLLAQLGFPATAHNSIRLFDAAIAGESFDEVVVELDRPLPAIVRGDEALLLTALAEYFHRYAIDDEDARIYDIEAFLGVPHHDHNVAIIASWLACELPFYSMLALVSADVVELDAGVC